MDYPFNDFAEKGSHLIANKTIIVLSFVWTGTTFAIFQISGNFFLSVLFQLLI